MDAKYAFEFIFGIGRKIDINVIKTHYLEEGLTPRVHKNFKLLSHDAPSCVNFL